ncbi:MAG: serine/threonine-protein kinase, partial [Verrucomicrobiota bacterium]
REAALKVLPELHGTDEQIDQLLKEGRIMARLNDPNICGVYQGGLLANESIPYLLMEYASGRNCFDLVKEGWFDAFRTHQLIRQLCQALRSAHRVGVLHHDLKPANMILSDQGQLKVLDFGLSGDCGANEQLLGTAPYAAPEAYELGARLDERTDIYAVGIMMYEMITGRTPGERWMPASLLADCPPRLDQVILRCLQPWDQRYANASLLIGDLDSVFRPDSPESLAVAEAVS